MKIIKRGKIGGQSILLTGEMLTHWFRGYGQINEILKQEFAVLYVQIDGSEGEGNFTSIEDQVNKLTEEIQNKYSGYINFALGISMGANFLIELLSLNNMKFDSVVLDAPFLIFSKISL
jgi:surfactin synthase thioesterase subunit